MAASGSGRPKYVQKISDFLPVEHITQLNQMGYEFKQFLGKGAYGAALRCELTTTDDPGRADVKQLAAKVVDFRYAPDMRSRTEAEKQELHKYDEIKIIYTEKGKKVNETVRYRIDTTKQVPPDMIENPLGYQKRVELRTNVKNIETELQALSRAEHTNVVKLENVVRFYDEYAHNPYMAYIVMFMELAEGGDLSDYLVGKTHTEQETKQMMAQICCGVEHLHSRGIAHLDLKTENILVSRDQHNNMVLKLTDFGLSVLFTPGSTPVATEMRGTILYMCPVLFKQYNEVRNGRRQQMSYNPTKVDIWALGVITLIIMFEKTVVQTTYDNIKFSRQIGRTRFHDGYVAFLTSQQSSPELIDLLGQVFEDQDQNRRIDITQFCEHQWIRDAVIAHKASITPTPIPPLPQS